MTESDKIKTINGISKKTCIIVGVIAGVFLLLWIIFIALYAGSSGSMTKDIENATNEGKEKSKKIEALNNTYNEVHKENVNLKNDVDSLNKNITTLKANITTMNNTIIAQAAQIASLQATNMYLWIGGGCSLAGAVGGWGYGIYQNVMAGRKETEITQLAVNVTNYLHYYNDSYLWTVEDFTLYYMYGRTHWKTLYNSTIKWDKATLKANITNQPRTATLIMTKKGWLMAGVLRNAWIVDGTYVTDEKAFLMTVNRVMEAIMAPFAPANFTKAARIPTDDKNMIQFGEEEILIRSDRTGTAWADMTYWSMDTEINRDLYYANEANFEVEWMAVLQYDFVKDTELSPRDVKASLLEHYQRNLP